MPHLPRGAPPRQGNGQDVSGHAQLGLLPGRLHLPRGHRVERLLLVVRIVVVHVDIQAPNITLINHRPRPVRIRVRAPGFLFDGRRRRPASSLLALRLVLLQHLHVLRTLHRPRPVQLPQRRAKPTECLGTHTRPIERIRDGPKLRRKRQSAVQGGDIHHFHGEAPDAADGPARRHGGRQFQHRAVEVGFRHRPSQLRVGLCVGPVPHPQGLCRRLGRLVPLLGAKGLAQPEDHAGREQQSPRLVGSRRRTEARRGIHCLGQAPHLHRCHVHAPDTGRHVFVAIRCRRRCRRSAPQCLDGDAKGRGSLLFAARSPTTAAAAAATAVAAICTFPPVVQGRPQRVHDRAVLEQLPRRTHFVGRHRVEAHHGSLFRVRPHQSPVAVHDGGAKGADIRRSALEKDHLIDAASLRKFLDAKRRRVQPFHVHGCPFAAPHEPRVSKRDPPAAPEPLARVFNKSSHLEVVFHQRKLGPRGRPEPPRFAQHGDPMVCQGLLDRTVSGLPVLCQHRLP